MWQEIPEPNVEKIGDSILSARNAPDLIEWRGFQLLPCIPDRVMMSFFRLICVVALGLAIPSLAWAGDSEDIQQLIKARQFTQALDRADKALQAQPKDVQLRFLRALTLAELNRSGDAIKAFTALAEDHPQLPEPYNNLAVLYAQQNQLDKARAALQMAIQTNPSYAIAHENLGDLYARLASQSYDKALRLEGGNPNIKTKLTLVRELFGKTPIAAVATSKPALIKIEATPTLVATKPEASKVPVATAVVSTPIKAAPTAAPKPTEVATAKTPDTSQVTQAVQAWARAWSNRHVDQYLAAYDRNFTPPQGLKFNAWAKERRERIAAPKSIEVKLSDIRVEMLDDNTAKVRFRQTYRSDRLSSTTGKTLLLRKSGQRWLITQERAG